MFKETKSQGLPDPFLRSDGIRVRTHEEWNEHRLYLKGLLADYLYGHLPPPRQVAGTVAESMAVYEGRACRERLLLNGADGLQLEVFLIRPADCLRHPVIVWNQFEDLEQCPIEEKMVCDRGYAILSFRREQLAPDREGTEFFDGDVFGKAYPQYDARAVAIWGWAHSMVVTYLLDTDWADGAKIAVTGHSRGGKAALCAAAYDERIALCAANASGQGGGGCFRYLGGRLGNQIGQCESLGDLAKRSRFWYWFAERIRPYGNQDGESQLGREEELPFDLHTVRALIAPRPIICTEGLDDCWSNPYGTQISWRAAQEVYRFLGAKSANAMFFHEGGHAYPKIAWEAVLDFCDFHFFGHKPAAAYRCFAEKELEVPPLHFHWRAPDLDAPL